MTVKGALFVLISAIGTHKRLAHPPAKRIAPQPVGALVNEMRQTLSNRAFLILMLAGIFGYTNQGVGFAISGYNLNFVWQFSTGALFVSFTVIVIVSKSLKTGEPLVANNRLPKSISSMFDYR